MKKFIPLILIGLVTLIFTGCYTQIAMTDDDGYTYSAPEPIIIIILPPPPPPTVTAPIIEYPANPKGKIRNPETRPPRNDRIRDDLRNSGGRNEGGRRSR